MGLPSGPDDGANGNASDSKPPKNISSGEVTTGSSGGTTPKSGGKSTAACHRCASRLGCDKYKIRRWFRKWNKALAVIIAVMTIGGVLMPPVTLIVRGAEFKLPPADWCADPNPSTFLSKADFQWITLLRMSGSLAASPLATLLLWNAETGHLQLMAYWMVTIWLSSLCGAYFNIIHCNERDGAGFSPANMSMYYIYTIAEWFSGVLLWYVVYTRIHALERELVQDLGGRKIRQLTGIAVIVIILAKINMIVGPSRIAQTCFYWVIFVLICLSFLLMVRGFGICYRASNKGRLSAARSRMQEEMSRARRATLDNIIGSSLSMITQTLWYFLEAVEQGLWPMSMNQKPKWAGVQHRIWMSYVPHFLALFGAIFAAWIQSGVMTGSITGGLKKKKREAVRCSKRTDVATKYKHDDDEGWQEKVEELAFRGFTLKALLNFYSSLGTGTGNMPHFDPKKHTTNDVVRQAIIPMSSASQTALASVMMNGVKTRPMVMVTHNWGNLFTHLIASIIADALGEPEFCRVAWALEHRWDVLMGWLQKLDKLDTTYWVCAFSVSQHDGICGTNPADVVDSVTGLIHPVCPCGKPKFFNSDPPLRADGNSVLCEMNKFDDMMAFLAATDADFRQVIAVDEAFALFSRAWCIAELARAHDIGMMQHLKVKSSDELNDEMENLQHLKVCEMKASRPEDVAEILAKIPDQDQFDKRIQELLFGEVFADWHNLDTEEQLLSAGRIVRWQIVKDWEKSKNPERYPSLRKLFSGFSNAIDKDGDRSGVEVVLDGDMTKPDDLNIDGSGPVIVDPLML